MRLATYIDDGQPKLAPVVGAEVVALPTASVPGAPDDMRALLEAGAEGLAAVQAAIDGGGGRRPLDQVRHDHARTPT